MQDRMREVGRDLWSWLAEGAARLCLRRHRHGQGRRARAGRCHRGPRRAHAGPGGRLRRRSQEERPLPHRRVLKTPFAIERLERGFETICLPGHISFAASRMWENIDRKRLDGLQPVIVLQANIIDLMSWSRIREGRGWEV